VIATGAGKDHLYVLTNMTWYIYSVPAGDYMRSKAFQRTEMMMMGGGGLIILLQHTQRDHAGLAMKVWK
jgi:hypothetical protein